MSESELNIEIAAVEREMKCGLLSSSDANQIITELKENIKNED